MDRITHEQKQLALVGARLMGTKKAGAIAANITVERLNAEIKESAIFKRQVNESLSIGKSNLADNALEIITTYALNPPPKTDRNQLTAAIALANAFVPGFRGTSKIEGRIAHDVMVITAIPRPQYDIPKITTLDKEKLKALNRGENPDTVEEAIEGVIVNEEELTRSPDTSTG